MKPKTLTGTVLLGALFLTATDASASRPKKADVTDLRSFRQCTDMRDYLAEAYATQIAQSLSYPFHGEIGLKTADAPAAAQSADRSSANEGSGPSSYTKTNVQEAGVDENDTIKTDGRYVYSVAGQSVAIMKSWPVEDAEVISRIEFPQNVRPASLFLRGDKLVVMSQIWQQAAAQDAFNGTRVSVVDVSNRAKPRIQRQEDIEGWSYQSRMVGDDVYVVFNSYMQIPHTLWQRIADPDLRPGRYLQPKQHEKFVSKTAKKLYPQVRRELGKMSLAKLLPERRVVRGDGRVVSSEPLVTCSELRSSGSNAMSLVGVAHIDIDDAEDFGATAVLGHGWNIYASQDNLYISGTTYGWWADQDPSNYYKTFVHKFRLRGEDGQPTYAASGKVDGWLLNQFSMSEWNGDLRIGTTDWNIPGRDGGGNHLTVLRERDGKLEQIGAVRGLAKGERIYSMRMMGDIGYMVTFRQTDPLYTIDLSNPRKPEVLGELKINGFSSYIHPLGPNHLLTVGQDADDNGRILGLHLQIFDVSDLANPTRTHHKRLTGDRWSSWSPAMWDHHAFTFDARRKILVLPMTSYAPEQFTGAMVLQAHPKLGFDDMGFLTQMGGAGKDFCKQALDDEALHVNCEQANLMWAAQIQRTIIVDDYVLAMSQYGMTAHPLERPHETITSVFTLDGQNNYYGYRWW